MKKVLIALLMTVSSIAFAGTPDGMVNVKSSHDVKTTADRLEGILKKKGMKLFTRVPHSAGASKAGVTIRDTELLIFGNPKVGAPLMKCQQSVGIDLPQKALIWKDDKGAVWISYNDPRYLQKRHNISGCDEVLAKVTKALGGMTGAAAAAK